MDMVRYKDSFLDFGPGRKIHCVDAGSGPCVVYFPGNGCSVEDSGPLAERIAETYRFVGIDPPGRAPTQWPDGPFSFFDDLPAIIDRSLAELGVGDHVAMGHSMGGMYALQHANRHRGRVRALVLFEGFVTMSIHRATVAPGGFGPVRMAPDILAAFEKRRAANLKWEDDHPAFKASFWPSQQAHDARPWVADLGIPVLVYIGDMGQPLPHDIAGWRRQLGMDGVKDLTVETIPDAGHWMMLDDPALVLKTLTPFLARVAKKR